MKTSLQTIHHVMHVDIKVAKVLILTCEKDDKMHRVGNILLSIWLPQTTHFTAKREQL